MDHDAGGAFAIWITGLPASGKSTLAQAVKSQLEILGVHVEVLESDVLRQVLTPHPHYDEDERETFYKQMVFIGSLLAKNGIPVIFDATANRRFYRDAARQQIPRFLEVYVDCPLDLCMARDPKGIYRQARGGAIQHIPGLQASYEPPEHPDLIIRAGVEPPGDSARRIIGELRQKRYV